MTTQNMKIQFEQIVKKLNPENKLLDVWELKGGISAQVTGLAVLQPNGQIKKLIVRQHGDVDYKQNPKIAADEYKLLEILKSYGPPVPKPYYLDQSGEIFTRPYIVMEFIDGTPEMNDMKIKELASILTKIHGLDSSKQDLSFLPKQEINFEKLLNRDTDNTLNQWTIREILRSVFPFPNKNPQVILHGDFWPGNTLWKNGKLVGVIDWEDAALGDPISDLGNGRLEVLFQFGIEAMMDFTKHYKTLMTTYNYTDQPYWDLFAALRLSTFPEWGLDKNTEKTMREKHKWFVTQALEQIN
ncbi:phosphotransferase family enzyme [Bacillus oleivorans]|uniref:Phosphotransferase family enzyme n=1 Tax=Bacillus oleivorans TaxID=1448271 RepID=A0A285CM92_9BACI|nr:phosphotransferase [Bacillus oleivorans]SNX68651.1 phosphotransferase family enzyme [Bacillus oleivorans]